MPLTAASSASTAHLTSALTTDQQGQACIVIMHDFQISAPSVNLTGSIFSPVGRVRRMEHSAGATLNAD